MNTDNLARAITAALVSPNEADRNLEPANVVDGLFVIARAIRHLAGRLESPHHIVLFRADDPHDPDHYRGHDA